MYNLLFFLLLIHAYDRGSEYPRFSEAADCFHYKYDHVWHIDYVLRKESERSLPSPGNPVPSGLLQPRSFREPHRYHSSSGLTWQSLLLEHTLSADHFAVHDTEYPREESGGLPPPPDMPPASFCNNTQNRVYQMQTSISYRIFSFSFSLCISRQKNSRLFSPFSLFSSCLLTIILLFFPVNLFCLYPSLLCQEWMPPVKLFARYPFSAISLAATILTEPRSQ